MTLDLLKLPWATLLTLAAGYAGYFVANVGVRDHHKSIDVTFATLVFGFFAYGAYFVLTEVLKANILLASLGAFVSAMVLGGLWQRIGRRSLSSVLRLARVSFNDDLPSAWATMTSGTDTLGTQLTVILKDGTSLYCENLDAFRDEPGGACVLGGRGDILMYVTHRKKVGQESFTRYPDINVPSWGTETTYIPADQIALIRYRRTSAKRVSP